MTHPAPDQLFLDFQATVAGRYSLERELGRGGMGVVYLAREVRLDRPVAIKLLPPGMASNPKLRERFLREARTAAKLSHPNVIPIFAVEELSEFVFFAMAYVEGETLTERVRRRGPLPASEAARVLRDVAWALAYAHGQGVIHRDVKPDNILLENNGRVLVADFGIASVVAGAAGLSSEEIVGTPEFMSPEQALGEPVDGRSDLYSLGLVGFFALSGTLPFDGDKPTEVLAKQVTEPAAPLASVAPAVPRRIAQAIDNCLAKDRTERPEGTSVLADQLSRALEQRRELPVPLRVFVKRGARFDDAGALLYPFLLLAGVVATSPFTSTMVGYALFGAGITLVPAAVLVARARRLLKTGFDHGDLEFAFKAELDRDREERGGQHVGPSLLERIFRAISRAGFIWGGLNLTLLPLFLGFFEPSSILMGLSVGMWGATGAAVLLQRRRDVDTEFWGKVWTGRLGRWLFKLARAFTPARALPASLTHRPTELALGMAAEQLFESLPKDTRAQLRDLPDVVHRLEQDAQKMRMRLEELQEALADAKPSGEARHDRIVADLSAERELVQQRLKDAVAALETIRLNLLRLHAGTATVKSLTTDLGLAREVAREIDRHVQGLREIEEAL
ncbi:MAG TPA: protein kinase [Gemmatimonadales bacterium]|nr:protein kinase [Gemmatimonadales bacterium]